MTAKAMAVFAKETLDAARDRRSVASALIYSLFGPLVIALVLSAIARSNDDDKPLRLPVTGAEHAPSLVRYLEQNRVEVVPAGADARGAFGAGDFAVALVIPPRFAADFRASRPAEVEIVYDRARNGSERPVRRVERLLEEYGGRTAALRLAARGISPQVIQPVRLREVDLSTAASRAALALRSFPIFLLMAAFLGGMNVAIDTTAGERERGSLEPLLVQAVPRLDLVTGKWLAAVAFNLLAVALTLLFSFLVLRWDRLEQLDVPVALSAADTLRLLSLLLPLVLLVPALQMLMALFARSFKEAQTQMSLLLFLPVIPSVMLSLQNLEIAPWMRTVPILAEQVLIGDILRGQPVPPGVQALAAAASLAVTALCIAITTRLLRHERIVLGR